MPQAKISMLTMDQIPYGYKDTEGKSTGVLFDVMNAIMYASGVGEKNSLIPSKRMLKIMLSGDPACALLADTPDIEAQLDFITPIGYSLKAGILPRADSGITDYESLKGKIIAVPLGIQFDTIFHNDKSIIKVSPPKYVNAIQMLKAGRVDAVAGAIENLQLIARNNGMKEADLAVPIVLMEGEVQLVCSKEVLLDTRRLLEKMVNHLKTTGEIQFILHHYLDKK